MKYNFNVYDLNQNTAQGKILTQIQPGSIVLECGCATGYMTQFMKEKLHCKVYIVEYEQAAFDIAKQYAEDGICADLMRDEWVIKFQGMKFDYIIFADVLEHVYDPSIVLSNATKFLKEDGKLIASIPNIGHNDIILNLYYDNWNYTDLGLLDNTHIRFFGKNNLIAFFQNAGLGIVYQDYTRFGTLSTEQSGKIQNLDEDILYKVKERIDGEVYQFIIVAQLNEFVKQNNITPTIIKTQPNFVSTLFYKQNLNEEYTEKNTIFAEKFDGRVIVQNYNIKNIKPVELRFDPIEGVAIIVENIKAISNLGELTIMPINGIQTIGVDVFLTNDPQYKIIISNRNLEWVRISCNITPITDKNILRLANRILEEKEKLYLDKEKLHLEKEKILSKLEEREKEIKTIKNSRSWKITKPLRWIKALLR